jgi:hypothetical protein
LQVGGSILDYERFEGGAEVLWIWRITRSHDTRPVTRLASLLITALREMSAMGPGCVKTPWLI